MADLDRNNANSDLENQKGLFEEDYFGTGNYQEETAVEVAQPVTYNNQSVRQDNDVQKSGIGIGLAALALSILSLFVFPVLFGIAGIILGFVARRRGATSGTWAITIGVISLILGLFILPFF